MNRGVAQRGAAAVRSVRTIRWGGVLLGFVVARCSTDPIETGDSEGTSGRLVIVGGALSNQNDAVYEAVLEGRQGEGPICVFPTASASPDESMASAVERFVARAGAEGAVGISVTTDAPEAASDSAVVRQVEGCSGFWFVGGSQSRITEVFRPDGTSTPLLDAVIARHAEGTSTSWLEGAGVGSSRRSSSRTRSA